MLDVETCLDDNDVGDSTNSLCCAVVVVVMVVDPVAAVV